MKYVLHGPLRAPARAALPALATAQWSPPRPGSQDRQPVSAACSPSSADKAPRPVLLSGLYLAQSRSCPLRGSLGKGTEAPAVCGWVLFLCRFPKVCPLLPPGCSRGSRPTCRSICVRGPHPHAAGTGLAPGRFAHCNWGSAGFNSHLGEVPALTRASPLSFPPENV